MRRFLAGLLLLLFTTPALAEIKGEVESFGFNNHYRPNCWTPMVVRVQPEKSGTYQIRVIQEDLDRDRVVFSREITLTGGDDGAPPPQRFWMYFIPQPTDGGLYDVSRGGTKFGPAQYGDAIKAMASGIDVDYQGASGSCDLDDRGDVYGPYVNWRVVKEPSGSFAFKTVAKVGESEVRP